MIELFAPSLTKNVPMIDVTTQLAADQQREEHQRELLFTGEEDRARTMVATTVTA
jgi:hypothetical protein